ncbi:hypothetical protein [Prosthecobacter sp.]|uniref:hypothetical protein n=1 Tax=Prosthecobacter sp. TaxID=1965333 RepID=UPI003783F644
MNARDLLQQVKALLPDEQRRFMDALMDFDMGSQTSSTRMQVPDFPAYWQRLHSLGKPAWTVEETAGLDRWIAGEEDVA